MSSASPAISPRALGPALAGLALLIAAASAGCSAEGEYVFSSTQTEADLDGDGWLRPDDCDDDNDRIYPDAPESQSSDNAGDSLDNDCDGVVDEGTKSYDDDHDGYAERDGDCDDDSPVVFPGAPDGCDKVDGDCDGRIDEGAADALEPNDFRSSAVILGDGGVLTCQYAAVNMNLITTAFNSGGNDADWFTFYVEDADQTGCTYGITATLKNIPAGQAVEMRLYASGANVPIAQVEHTGSPSENSTYIQWKGPRNGSGAGYYYLEVTSPNGSSYCAADMRLVVQGLAPTIPTLPTGTPAP